MGRAKNPRRVVAEVIGVLQGNAATMRSVWTRVPSTSYWRDETTGKWTPGRRERKDIPASEYPENRPEEWERLALFMTTIAKQAQDVAAYAEMQAQEVRVRLHAQAARCANAGCGGSDHLCR